MPNVVWTTKSEDEKKKHFETSVTAAKNEKTIIVSTDGGLEIPVTAAVVRKPGQRKCVHSGRTRTMNKWTKLA